jgi:signal transduction histidine kinase/HPt (histidine-containing phosphotransfer) domain-containing protein
MVDRIAEKMKTKPVDILIFEDSPGDLRLLKEYLKDAPITTGKFLHAITLAEGLSILEQETVDIVLLDLQLPDSAGIDTFRRLHKQFPLQAVVVLTGFDDIKMALEAVHLGAQDFLDKNTINEQVISRAIKYALERHQTMRRLEEAQELAKVGSWRLDLSTNELSCTSMVYHIFERDPGEFATLADYIGAVHPGDQEALARIFKKAFEDGGEFRFDHRILFAPGREKFVSLQGRAQFNDYNRPISLSGTVQDITERKQVDELIRKTRLAEERATLKQEFLAKTSHEIRTPLNPILLLTKMLLDSNVSPQQREYLNAIKTAGDTLLAVVNDVLDLSKIEAGKIDFNHTPFNLEKNLESLREMLEFNAREKGLELTFHIDPQVHKHLIGDPVRLTQVLLNLIGNAIKFTNEGWVKVSVRQLKQEGRYITLQFEVADSGIGIPDDKLSMIFDSFRQVENEINLRHGGTGLGLSIVKQLVKLQGGKIHVRSKFKEGSVFGFELMFEAGAEDQQARKESVVIDKKRLRGSQILLVEDNPLNQMVTKAVLEDWGVDVDIAIHGKQGIHYLENRDYDLVLMDLQMPEMDGYEATRYIRNKMQGNARNTPIIALTANAFTGMDDECMKIGMNDYISKPFDKGTLYSKIVQHARVSGRKTAQPSNGENYKSPLETTSAPTNGNAGAATSTPQLTDLSYLKGIAGGDNSLIQRAVGKFLESTPETVLEMDQCLASKSYLDLSKLAHKLKSSVATMGMTEAREAMFTIEQIGKGTDQLEKLPALVAHAKDLVNRSYKELEEALKAL